MKKVLAVLSFFVFLTGVVATNAIASENRGRGFSLFGSDDATPPGLLHALTRTPNPRAQEARERVETRLATLSAQLAERRKELIRKFFNRMVERIEAAIERLERLIGRIERRIAKLEAAGEDMTDVKNQVNDAKTKLGNAKDDLQDAKDGLEDILSSNDPKAAFKEVGQTIRAVVRQLVEVHRILVHVIGDIKGLRVGQEGTPPASGSPSPSPSPSPTASPSPSPSPTATP
ncbi:hypothetical protein HYV21_01485 [Candidatus Microgenomates bacterium]|nr:hypothetical protein [Candidatus Microgenomates bacterium]